ncbi:MAG TPA: peptidoglycan-associated lipoprotein Pal [Candidatus Eisenbacteria bacterium]|nr:peptidoglycan-associated lipoprotein Pal [Candidatus Eisenbacteria bacterium]
MSRPRIVTIAFAMILAASLATLGCSSRKQAQVETPPSPPPPTETTEAPPPPPPAASQNTEPTETAAGLQDAFYDYDDASIRADARAALEANGRYLERNTNMNVIIEGHCDERGSVEYNLALGERRARAAKEFLTSYGIPANRMTTISYGKERPFATGSSEEAWAQNRRAHFVSK